MLCCVLYVVCLLIMHSNISTQSLLWERASDMPYDTQSTAPLLGAKIMFGVCHVCPARACRTCRLFAAPRCGTSDVDPIAFRVRTQTSFEGAFSVTRHFHSALPSQSRDDPGVLDSGAPMRRSSLRPQCDARPS